MQNPDSCPQYMVIYEFDSKEDLEAFLTSDAAEVAKNIARSRKHHVVVYGDGGNPDSGKHWAASLSGSGIKNVVFISGGADALRRLEALHGEKQ